MLGVPKVLRQARVIIMGQNYLNHFNTDLHNFRKLTTNEKAILYDTLQFIAESKRDYHQNHFHLSKLIIEHFQIETQKNIAYKKIFLNLKIVLKILKH